MSKTVSAAAPAAAETSAAAVETETAAVEPETAAVPEESALLYPNDVKVDEKAVSKTAEKAESAESAKEPAKKAPEKAEKPVKTATSDDEDADKNADKKVADEDSEELSERVQKRINKEVARRRSEERAKKALAEENAALKTQISQLTPAEKAAKAVNSDEPDPKDYDLEEFDPQYLKDIRKWERDQYIAETKRILAEERNRESEAKSAETVAQKQASLKTLGESKYDDFADLVLGNSDLEILTPDLAPIILDNPEAGIEALYNLSTDEATLEKVSAMTPAQQILWFGKFSAQHQPAEDKEPEKEAKKVSTAASVKYPKGSAAGANLENKPDWEVLYPNDV